MTTGGGLEPRVSSDGRYVYYATPPVGDFGVRRIPLDGGTEEAVVSGVRYREWDLTDEGIFFFRDGWLEFYAFETGLTEKKVRIAGVAGGLSVTDDGRWLYFAQDDSSGVDIELVRNFR